MSENWNNHRALAETDTEKRDFVSAEQHWRAALREASAFDLLDRRLALTLEGLAEILWHQGKFDEATQCCERLLGIYEKVFGPEQYDVGVISNNLAMLYHVREEFTRAESHYKRALRIKTAHLGKDHADVIKLTGNYANLLKAVGKPKDAEQLTSEETVITARNWKKTKYDTPSSDAPQPNKDNGKSTREATIIAASNPVSSSPPSQPLTPPNPVSVAVGRWEILRRLAETAMKENRFEEAEAIWFATVKYFEPYGADDQRRLAYTLDGLAACLCARQQLLEAEPFFKRAIDIKEKNLGAEHIVVAKSLNNLARLYYQINRFPDAEPLAKRCVSIYEKIYGPAHPDYATALHNLGTLYHTQVRFPEAEPLYWQALKIRQRTLGPDHPETAGLARSLATLLRSTGRAQEAIKIHGDETSVITGTWRALEIPEDAQLTTG